MGITFLKKKLTLERTLLFGAFFFFLSYTLLSYMGRPWVMYSITSNNLKQNVNTGMLCSITLILAMVCFLGLVVSQFMKKRLNPIIITPILILFGFGLFWVGYDFLFSGRSLVWLLRDPFSSFTFFIPLAIFIGMKDSLWSDIKKYTFACAIVLIFASFISAIDFYRSFNTEFRPVACGMIYWFYKGFFLLLATILFTDEWRIKYKPLTFILIIMLFVVAAILQARSWFIQTIILFVIYMATAKNKRGSNLLTVLISAFILLIFFATNEEIFNGLLNRFTTSGDTRSGQLEQFFEQISFKDLMLGQGTKANYIFGSADEFNYIDNQILLSLFRFGVIPTVAYGFLLIYPIFKSIDEGNKKCLKQSLLLIIWILAILGLSVFFNLSFEIAGFVVFIMVGRNIAELGQYRSRLWRKNVV